MPTKHIDYTDTDKLNGKLSYGDNSSVMASYQDDDMKEAGVEYMGEAVPASTALAYAAVSKVASSLFSKGFLTEGRRRALPPFRARLRAYPLSQSK